jgi:hypothetical protein
MPKIMGRESFPELKINKPAWQERLWQERLWQERPGRRGSGRSGAECSASRSQKAYESGRGRKTQERKEDPREL